MRAQYTPRIIFSVHRNDREASINALNHVNTAMALKHTECNPIVLNGVYKGQAEKSFMMRNTETNLGIAKKLAEYYGQESILLIDNEGTGVLHFINGGTERLGRMRVSNVKPIGYYSQYRDEYLTFE